jgi:hypothetical protein
VSPPDAAGLPDFHPSVAESPDGRRLVAAWVTDRGNLDKVVQVATSADGGATWSPAAVLFAARGGDYLDPTRLAYDAQGNLHLAFMSGLRAGRRIHHRALPRGADPLASAAWRAGGAGGVVCSDCLGPELAIDARGAVHLLYEGNEGGNHLGLRRTVGAGGVWEPARRIARAGHDLRGALAVTPDGALHLAYLDVAERAVIYARHAADRPGAAEVEQRVSTAAVAEPPAIAAGRDGSVHLAWEQGGVIVHRAVERGAPSELAAISGEVTGRQSVTMTVDGAGIPYVSWTAHGFKRVYQNRRIGGAWQGAVLLTDAAATARYQQYGRSALGAVDLVFVERGGVRFLRVAGAGASP